MIQRVYEQAMKSGAEQVVIATDDERIKQAAEDFSAGVCMTSVDHASGTDRIAEVAKKLRWPNDCIVVNLQGDEPEMPPALIHQVAEDMQQHPKAGVTTLCAKITESPQLFDPHVVKVVMDHEGYAHYFSRAPIPWHRDEFNDKASHLPENTPSP